MKSLYELSLEMIEIIEQAEQEAINNDGEISEVLASAIEWKSSTYEGKIENTIKYIKNLEAEAEALKAEKARIAHRQKVAENKAERLKKYLGDCNAVGFSCVAGEVKSRTSKVVEVLPLVDLADEYLRYKSEPNKSVIKKALEDGIEIDGARLIDSVKVSVK